MFSVLSICRLVSPINFKAEIVGQCIIYTHTGHKCIVGNKCREHVTETKSPINSRNTHSHRCQVTNFSTCVVYVGKMLEQHKRNGRLHQYSFLRLQSLLHSHHIGRS